MKKSLEEAIIQAYRHSMLYPGMMDKPRKHAIVCASEWVYRARVLDGWHTVLTYRNGKEV